MNIRNRIRKKKKGQKVSSHLDVLLMLFFFPKIKEEKKHVTTWIVSFSEAQVCLPANSFPIDNISEIYIQNITENATKHLMFIPKDEKCWFLNCGRRVCICVCQFTREYFERIKVWLPKLGYTVVNITWLIIEW